MAARETKAQAARRERRGESGGHYYVRMVEGAAELEQALNEGHELGYVDLEWYEREAGGIVPDSVSFLVWGTKPGPDECPACGRDLVDDADEPDA